MTDQEKLLTFYQRKLREAVEENIRLFGMYCEARQELFELKGGVGGFLAADAKEPSVS
jgi:hypothetical protein